MFRQQATTANVTTLTAGDGQPPTAPKVKFGAKMETTTKTQTT